MCVLGGGNPFVLLLFVLWNLRWNCGGDGGVIFALCIIIPLEVRVWWGVSRGLPLHFYPVHCDSVERVCSSAVEGRRFHVVLALHTEIQDVHVGLCPFLLALIQIQCCGSQADSSETTMQVVKIVETFNSKFRNVYQSIVKHLTLNLVSCSHCY